jgi:hypothetical protein
MSVNIGDMRHEVVSEPFQIPIPKTKADVPNPTPKITKKMEELKKEAQKQEEEEKRVSLQAKIDEYLSSSYLKPYFGGISKPSSSASLVQLESCMECIRNALKRNQKRLMVDTLFTGMVSQGENIVVHVLRMPQYKGIFDLIEYDLRASEENKADAPPPLGIRRELEEISIELESNWVPGPYARLGFKLFQAFNFVAEKNRQGLINNLDTQI